jgi:hypothetical protein
MEMRVKLKNPLLAFVHESYEIQFLGRSSDLLPRASVFPFQKRNSDMRLKPLFAELTAAGQLQSYTVFPFNLAIKQEPKKLPQR